MISIAGTKKFITDARSELRKVVWPTKQQTMSSTWVVIVVTFVLAAFLGLVDLFLSKGIGFIIK